MFILFFSPGSERGEDEKSELDEAHSYLQVQEKKVGVTVESGASCDSSISII